MFREQLQYGVAYVGMALREQKEFARRWNSQQMQYPWWVWVSQIATATLGRVTYGMTRIDVVIHAIKFQAVAVVTLVGILLLHAALGLAVTIFLFSAMSRDAVLLLGLILPFVAGLLGTSSLHRGLSTLTDTMTYDRREHREYRECFLPRLILSWSAVHPAVSPVLIFTF